MSVAVRRGIYGKLSGDTTLTNMLGTPAAGYNKAIYFQVAPEDAHFPYVIFQQQAGTPQYAMTTNGSAPAFDNEVWTIKAVDGPRTGTVVVDAGPDPADNIASRLDVLLTDGTISISGKVQCFLRRDTDLPGYAEVRDGVTYRHAGAMFRLVYTT